jgi:hypothetical protein
VDDKKESVLYRLLFVLRFKIKYRILFIQKMVIIRLNDIYIDNKDINMVHLTWRYKYVKGLFDGKLWI